MLIKSNASPVLIGRPLNLHEYKKGGDFADLLIVNQAKERQAKKLISFDKKLQKKFPNFVIEKLRKSDL